MRSAGNTMRHQGFTLIEVLVALIVLGIGLLGIAQMQALSLAYNHSSGLRSQAILQAYDISERIRANPTATYDTHNQTAQDNQCAATPANTTPSTCNPGQMAQNDLYEWKQDLTNLLPSGTGTITKSGSTYLIAISWNERSKQGVVGKTFNLSFQP